MDAQQTYLLNGLLARQYGLGRIVRFRHVNRGRQAEAFELFTAEEREYLVQLYPPTFTAEHLTFIARAVNALDEHRFSVVPFIKTRIGTFTAEGPQNSHLLVSLAPSGSIMGSGQCTDHDASQIGLRLAWMHRLLKEQMPVPPTQPPLARRLRDSIAGPTGALGIPAEQIKTLLESLELPSAQGWAHGDIQLHALLVDGDRQLRTVTDWALLHAGCPLEDVVDAFLAVCREEAGTMDAGRGRAMLEAYHSLVAIQRIPWTPVVASWCAQRILDAAGKRRSLPEGFEIYMARPERLATALASCI